MYNKKSFGSAIAHGALGVSVACLLAGAASAANEPTLASPAAQSQVTMQKQVRYNDLDLSTKEGRAVLDQRVRFAASDVCDGKNVSNSRTPVAYLECYSVAVRDAKQQMTQRLAMTQGSTVTAIR